VICVVSVDFGRECLCRRAHNTSPPHDYRTCPALSFPRTYSDFLSAGAESQLGRAIPLSHLWLQV